MADKATYLSDLQGLSYVLEVGIPILVEENVGVDFTIYDVDVLENGNAGRATIVSHRFAVYNEGGGGEAAYCYGPPYKAYYRENDTVYSAVASYVSGLSPVKGFSITEYNTDNQWAKVRAFVYVADHIEERQYFVYNDGGLTHEDIQ